MFTFRSVFGPLKKKWQEISSSFTTETACPVTHANFFRLFTKSWSSLKPDYLVNGFRVTGIYPFNPSAIPNEAYLPSQLYADPLPTYHSLQIVTWLENVHQPSLIQLPQLLLPLHIRKLREFFTVRMNSTILLNCFSGWKWFPALCRNPQFLCRWDWSI